jgi:hypothetical protein
MTWYWDINHIANLSVNLELARLLWRSCRSTCLLGVNQHHQKEPGKVDCLSMGHISVLLLLTEGFHRFLNMAQGPSNFWRR